MIIFAIGIIIYLFTYLFLRNNTIVNQRELAKNSEDKPDEGKKGSEAHYLKSTIYPIEIF